MQVGIHVTSPYHVLTKAVENPAQVNLNAKLINTK
jgi:hypothetical protein